jgi:hypothetical protein
MLKLRNINTEPILNLGWRIMYKSMMLSENKMVWENSENVGFFLSSQNYLPYQYT